MIANLLSAAKLGSMSEYELYLKIGSFLGTNYIFVKYDLPQLFGNGIYFTSKLAFRGGVPDLNLSAEELWHEGYLDAFEPFTKSRVNSVYDEFSWQCLEAGRAPKTRLIKNIISQLIEDGELTRYISFNRELVQMVAEGRKKVSRIRPLNGLSGQRKKVELLNGQCCYFSWHQAGIANPAFIYSSSENSYRLLFFTNSKEDKETSRLEINDAIFITVPKDQVGLNPVQAVRQNYY